MTLGSIRERMFPRQPQPAAAPGPTQLLPIKTYREPASPKPKAVTASSRVSDLVEVVGVGQFRIRVPRGFDFRVKGDPFALAEQMTLDRLMAEALDGSLSWPDGITGPAKRMTPAERKAERIATIRRIAEGPKDYAAMLANEGFNVLDHPWDPPTADERTTSTLTRRAREIRGLLRGRIFGR